LQEKPFADINGSGKHNNWSIGTTDGVNLLNAKQVEKATGSAGTFPIILAALIAGVDKHGDLMRAAISCPGNDFRLGACEAPPAVISAYLGHSVTGYLDEFRNGKVKHKLNPNPHVHLQPPKGVCRENATRWHCRPGCACTRAENRFGCVVEGGGRQVGPGSGRCLFEMP
jgi:hypothetical protein